MISIRRFLLTPRLAIAGLTSIGCGLFAAAPAVAAPAQCSNPLLSQPFASWGDSNNYTLAPGESANNFTGTGWTLSGGASIVTTQLADGTTSKVLDLPSGATAISPVLCVNSSMPTARTMVRDVVGSEGVFFYVNYPTTPGWQNTGQVHGQQTGWTLSDSLNIHTDGFSGWTQGQFEFVAGGNASDFQVYNFYVDPYRRG